MLSSQVWLCGNSTFGAMALIAVFVVARILHVTLRYLLEILPLCVSVEPVNIIRNYVIQQKGDYLGAAHLTCEPFTSRVFSGW